MKRYAGATLQKSADVRRELQVHTVMVKWV